MLRVGLPLAFFFAATVWSAHPAAADAVLAIGIGAKGVYQGGWVYGWDNGAAARASALNLCRGIDKTNNAIPDNASAAQAACRVVGIFTGQCVAIAANGTQTTPATGLGWVITTDSTTAKAQALAACEAMPGKVGPPCTIQTVKCDGSAQ